MARAFDAVPDHLVGWLEAQPLFFVATAPAGEEGHVNVSPKGYDTFRVLGPNEVAYLDLTGSGAETIAHLRDSGRLTLMFCSFDEKPNIVRLYGRGRTVLPSDPGFAALSQRFPDLVGTRAVVVLDVARVSTSCGYAVPRMDVVGVRPTLDDWAARKGADALVDYRAEKNAVSIDGLPALAD